MAEKKGFCIKPFLQIKKFHNCFFDFRISGQFPRVFKISQSLKTFFRFCSMLNFWGENSWDESSGQEFKTFFNSYLKDFIPCMPWSKERLTASIKHLGWSFKWFKQLCLFKSQRDRAFNLKEEIWKIFWLNPAI